MPQVWTSNEEINFLKSISAKKDMKEISRIHNRSVSALELRLKKIIHDNIQSKTANEQSLAKLLNMNVDKIRQYNYEYKGFIEKKNNNNQSESLNLNDNNKLVLEPPTKIKSINNISGGSKSIYSDDPSTKEKFLQKINIIKKENKIMRHIVENSELRHKLNNLIRNGKIDKKVKKVIKKVINSN